MVLSWKLMGVSFLAPVRGPRYVVRRVKRTGRVGEQVGGPVPSRVRRNLRALSLAHRQPPAPPNGAGGFVPLARSASPVAALGAPGRGRAIQLLLLRLALDDLLALVLAAIRLLVLVEAA